MPHRSAPAWPAYYWNAASSQPNPCISYEYTSHSESNYHPNAVLARSHIILGIKSLYPGSRDAVPFVCVSIGTINIPRMHVAYTFEERSSPLACSANALHFTGTNPQMLTCRSNDRTAPSAVRPAFVRLPHNASYM